MTIYNYEDVLIYHLAQLIKPHLLYVLVPHNLSCGLFLTVLQLTRGSHTVRYSEINCVWNSTYLYFITFWCRKYCVKVAQ